jgi:hypothetical protein
MEWPGLLGIQALSSFSRAFRQPRSSCSGLQHVLSLNDEHELTRRATGLPAECMTVHRRVTGTSMLAAAKWLQPVGPGH